MSTTADGTACIRRAINFLKDLDSSSSIAYFDKEGCGENTSFNDRIKILECLIYTGRPDSVTSVVKGGGHFIKGHIRAKEIAKYKCCNFNKLGLMCDSCIKINKCGSLRIVEHNFTCLQLPNSETAEFAKWCSSICSDIWRDAVYHVGCFQQVSYGKLTEDMCYKVFSSWLRGKTTTTAMFIFSYIYIFYIHFISCTLYTLTSSCTLYIVLYTVHSMHVSQRVSFT